MEKPFTKKFSHEETKDVNIKKAYGAIALSEMMRPTIRDLR